jgi:tetratricopeptide (TPR) repeat protein
VYQAKTRPSVRVLFEGRRVEFWNETFLSPEHWQKIAAAAAGEEVDARRQLDAQVLWLRAHRALCLSNAYPVACEMFQDALLADPGMADAALGLLVLAMESPIYGETATMYELCAVIADRLGQEQTRTGRGIRLTFQPGFGTELPIAFPDDLRVVYAMDLVERGDNAAARIWLSRCNPSHPSVLAFSGFLDLVEDETGGALEKFERLRRFDPLQGDAAFGVGLAYAYISVWDEAQQAFIEARSLVDQSTEHGREMLLNIRYALATAYHRQDLFASEKAELELIYELAPGHWDVAERLGRPIPEGAAPDLEASWTKFLGGLAVADEPEEAR